MPKYELLITAEYRSVCKSQFEALFLCAIAGSESGVIQNATDKDLSDRVINLDVKILFVGNRIISIGTEKQFHQKNNSGSEWYSPKREQELLQLLKTIDLEVV